MFELGLWCTHVFSGGHPDAESGLSGVGYQAVSLSPLKPLRLQRVFPQALTPGSNSLKLLARFLQFL
jgi:hypothetical protein